MKDNPHKITPAKQAKMDACLDQTWRTLSVPDKMLRYILGMQDVDGRIGQGRKTLPDILIGIESIMPEDKRAAYKGLSLEVKDSVNVAELFLSIYSNAIRACSPLRSFNDSSAFMGMCFGAALMQYVHEHPDSVLVKKLDELLCIDFSKEAEKGMERVIKRRDKRKQDKRKSDADAKRKSAAISTMKKLVPQIGQVKASEEVERRMNKRHYESNGAIQKVLPVSPGTIKRWYNAKLAEENEARNEAAKRRLGRIPT